MLSLVPRAGNWGIGVKLCGRPNYTGALSNAKDGVVKWLGWLTRWVSGGSGGVGIWKVVVCAGQGRAV